MEWIVAAHIHSKNGEFANAVTCCDEALSLNSYSDLATATKARAMMSGMEYLDMLSRIHNELKPATYVEIGVCRGHSLVLAQADTQTVAIDPNPQIQH
ncbi:MAG: hypothetical protein JXR76_21150 [Deltaproteobacteria bacterium]|nr:hypothetical protein [Deltaproteobacteria bacterium]